MAKAQHTNTKKYLSINGMQLNLESFEGGIISAEVIKDNPGPGLAVRKHLGNIHYGDFIFEAGPRNEITEMVKKAWNGENIRLNGSFLSIDPSFKVIYEDFFQDSLVAETTIPECDVASKDAAYFNLRITPSFIRYEKGDGRAIPSPGKLQKSMLKCNFRFELGELPCSKVAAIDSFSVLLNIASEPKVNNGHANKNGNPIDFPNLLLTISSADILPWLAWHKKFIIEGKNSQPDELTGRLVFLAPNLKDELFAITLRGVGIFSLQRNMEAEGTSSRFRVGLFCEQMSVENIKE